ncbi:hypothetical protein KAR91_08610, partial [Candidatus Pacearchaeota archaeon]|nr:hypothetical protein [Candidatus Pacearchaeota archaeon]
MPNLATQPEVWNPTLSRKQSDAWWALADPIVRELMFGGAKFGGKSWFGCHWSYHTAYDIACKYVPQPR